MRFSHIIAASMASTAVAQDSVCDKYTKALFKDNTAKNQATLLTALVNTVVIGNCTFYLSIVGLSIQLANHYSRHHAQRWYQGSRYPCQG